MHLTPQPADPLPPWWKGWQGLGALALSLILLAGGLWYFWPAEEDTSCAAGVPGLHWAGEGTQRECVGLMDETAYTFDPQLKGITDRIVQENQRVRQQWEKPDKGKSRVPYVKVAVLTPMTDSDTSALPMKEILTSLEGSFIAQCRANGCPQLPAARSLGIQGKTPQIELVLANEGRDETHWQPVVKQLSELTKGEHPLVAVTGMGVSIPETQAAADELSRLKIPTIGAVLTATDLNSPRLFKVSPSNVDYAKALRRFLTGSPLAKQRGYLVFDSRDDNYVKTLRKAFDDVFGDYIGRRRASFVGTTGHKAAGIPKLFQRAVNNICLTKTQLIFYAGRDRDLADFVRALSTRSQCGHDKPITVMTGATGTFAQGSSVRGLLHANKITVVDVSATSPDQWTSGVHAPAGFKPFLQALRDLKFDDSVMDDGYAIMHHDAVLTAVWATRNVTGQTASEAPDVQDVYNELTNLHDASTVPAASGELSFDDASNGWPHNKPIPVIQLPDPLKDPEPPYLVP
ncbi:ABC transporter substrate-binding protein [Streptomyces sp. NRRL S-337]|uniref:ABC transporter substrate-binding protein n=1 Tax=Streptomyces sp. NRRL S-337 TaxID=1463900 RepID=UPI0004CC5360|nr:ABC transporter substrate-binding protein [Streptomyces sp. NRRL S-337]